MAIEKNQTRKRAKGGGRKKLPEETRKANRQNSIKKYNLSRKKFTCVFSKELHSRLKEAKVAAGLSYENLFSEMLKIWKFETNKIKN